MKRKKYLIGISGYGFFQCVLLALCKAYTTIAYPTARLVRLPISVRLIGEFGYGSGLTTGYFNRIDVFDKASLSIGNNFEINDFCHIACAQEIQIGDDVLIASKVFISDHDHKVGMIGEKPNESGLTTSPVRIGDRVWIGENVSILKGVTIGDDVVIGAGSVVTKSIPDGSIAVGVPARVIDSRNL